MNRVLTAVRIQVVNWQTIALPWGIMVTALLLNLAIFGSIGDDIPGGPKTGALISAYLVLLIQSGVSMTQQFPYTLGLGLTRRSF